MRVFTIGYESATMADFIKALTTAGVERVIDVRAVPNSRRPGFSKTPLRNALAEAGIENVEADAWMGMVAPAGTPKAILDKLHGEIVAILKMPQVVEQLGRVYMEPVGNTPQEMAAVIQADLKRWQPLIEKYKISLD